jgi:Topoisomerase IA
LQKNAIFFINACDYDIEGTVIGTNIIKTINKNLKNSKRMKFSTTTNEDIIKAYNNLMDLDINNFYAGEARHMLDWLWGINLSIALTRSVYNSNFSKNTLSIGRVQGPSLGLLTNREFEISNFIPKPFWKISIIIKTLNL